MKESSHDDIYIAWCMPFERRVVPDTICEMYVVKSVLIRRIVGRTPAKISKFL